MRSAGSGRIGRNWPGANAQVAGQSSDPAPDPALINQRHLMNSIVTNKIPTSSTRFYLLLFPSISSFDFIFVSEYLLISN